MAIQTSSVNTEKITVSLPRELVERLRELIPARRRSVFIAEALQEKLALEEQYNAIEEAAGAWKDEDHPEFQTDEGIDRWLSELRGSWDDRVAQLHANQQGN